MKSICLFCSLVLCILFLNSAVLYPKEVIGKITPLEGSTILAGAIPIRLTTASPLRDGTVIKTGKDSSARAVYNDTSSIHILSNSTVTFRKKNITIKRGTTRMQFFKKNSKFRIYSPVACLGLIGTTLNLSVIDKNHTTVEVTEGKIWVQALKGKRQKLELARGETAQIDSSGKISQNPGIQKTEIENQHSDTDAPVDFNEKVSENLHFNGSYSFQLIPIVLNTPYRVLIDGYPSYNGKELIFQRAKQFTFEKLEEGEYEITIIANGIENSFFIEVGPENPRDRKIVKYVHKTVIPFIHGQSDTSNRKERLKYLKYSVIHNGRKNTLDYYTDTIKPDHGYTVKLDGSDLLPGNVFFIPDDMEQLPVIEIEYTGIRPVRKRIQTVKFNTTDTKYEVKF